MFRENPNTRVRFYSNQENKKNEQEVIDALLALGMDVNKDKGQLYYHPAFQLPEFKLKKLVIVRHGETYGNCGQSNEAGLIDYRLVNERIKNPDRRIFQGRVDSEINQLTEEGKEQAQKAADELKREYLSRGFEFDCIYVSPLKRAYDTALPFIHQNNLQEKCRIDKSIVEMSFGACDNRRVCDLPSEEACHSFYQQQNALFKQDGMNALGQFHQAESFAEVLLRAHHFLLKLNDRHEDQNVILFTHSMFSAALLILLGQGQKHEEGEYLAFDGKRKDNSCYTFPHATPFCLSRDTLVPEKGISQKKI